MVKTLMFRFVSAKSYVSQVMVFVLQVFPPRPLPWGVWGVGRESDEVGVRCGGYVWSQRGWGRRGRP